MKRLALFLIALALLPATLTAAPAADSPGMLRVLTYDRTIPRQVCLEFTEKTGIPVDVTTAISSLEAADFLYRKKQDFDLLLLANDVVIGLRDRRKLLPLDHKKIPAISQIKKKWLHAIDDIKFEYRVPLDVASMGLLVDRRISQPRVTGYMDAFRKARPGGVAVIVDQRDFLAAALLSLGASVNELSADNLRAARVILEDWLRNTAQSSRGIWSNGNTPAYKALRSAIVEGRHGAVLLYSGDALSLMTEFPDRYDWINPVEGGLKYLTVAAIPKNSARPEAAHKFINFICNPKVASQLAVAQGFGVRLNAPWPKLPLNFYGNPADIQANQLLDYYSVQKDITREPREEMEALFRALPEPAAPPAP